VTFEGASIGSSTRKQIAIENTGSAPLVVDRVGLTEGDADEVDEFEKGEPWFDGAEILPGESKSLAVVYAPQNIFEDRGQLTFRTNDPDRAEVTVALKSPDLGNPPPRRPCLKMEPEPQKFGAVEPGESASRTIVLEHCREGGPPLRIERWELTGDLAEVFRVEGELGGSFEIPAGGTRQMTVVFEPPEGDGKYQSELSIETNDPNHRSFSVDLVGRADVTMSQECPTAVARAKVKGGAGQWRSKVSTAPLETLVLDGSGSSDPDGSIARYEWNIVERPTDSTARLTPGSDVAKPELFLDLAGTYVVELSVVDKQENRQCDDPARVTVEAVPQEDIYVELVWDTPKDDDQTDSMGADLDLHYLNPKATSWNQAPYDIFPLNKTADWGQEGTSSDDPSLKIEDDDGAGPEVVGHNNPVSGLGYTIGVYYYDDGGCGPSFATVRIYIDGNLSKEMTGKLLKQTYKFWKVAIVNWPLTAIYEQDRVYDGFPN
jgi:hypothetical protein